MELLNRLKSIIWNEVDEDEGYEEPRRVSSVTPFEPCAGKVILVKPDLYINVGLLTSYLCAGYLVMVNLSGVTSEGARRIVDFLSGAAYSRDGTLLQVSCKVYLLAPFNVSVSDWNEVKEEDWVYDNAFNF